MTTRPLTSQMLAAIQAGTVYPAILYEGEFANADTGQPETLRLWTGVGTLSWDGKSWLGAGKILGISPIEESGEVKAVGFTVSLSGIRSEDKQRALAGVRQNRSGKLWLALFDASGALIADPYLLQEGRLDTSVLETSGDTTTISVQYESHLVDLQRPRIRYYTSEDQKLEYPTDKGFDQVPQLQDMQLIWGR